MQQEYETEGNFTTKSGNFYHEPPSKPSIVITVVIVCLVSAVLFFMERARTSEERACTSEELARTS
jgi:hypothetical protein